MKMQRIFIFLLSMLLVLNSFALAQEEGEDEETDGEISTEGKRIDNVILDNVPQPEGSRVVLDERTGTLIVTNTPTNIKKIEEIIEAMDKPPTQVLIEVKFIEASEATLKDIGIHWPLIDLYEVKNAAAWGDTDFGDRSEHRSTGFNSFADEGLEMESGVWKVTGWTSNLILRALKQTGDSDVLAAPRVTTLNNQKAIIKVVKERTFLKVDTDKTTAKWEEGFTNEGTAAGWHVAVPDELIKSEYGIFLTVTPEIGEKVITLTLKPRVKALLGADLYGFVRFGYRDINTRVVIEDGQTVIMGGLISAVEKEINTKVPLLGDVPLLGKLFQRNIKEESRKNLLIFVTCHLLTPSGEKFVEVQNNDQ